MYLITGALIQYYLHQNTISIRASKLLLIYLITGTIVTTIFHARSHGDFYMYSSYYFTVLSSSVVFWLYDLTLFRRK